MEEIIVLAVSAESIILRVYNLSPHSLLFIDTALSNKKALIITFTIRPGIGFLPLSLKRRKVRALSPSSFTRVTPLRVHALKEIRWSHGACGARRVQLDRQRGFGRILAFVSASNDSTGLPRKIIQRFWAVIYAESRVNCREFYDFST